ncbi:cytochrome c oxidase assembly factor Coa1 family protein [soil metagenome]
MIDMTLTGADGNTSGQGASATPPPEVRRWSWGAFLLTWIWGIGNNTFIALLMFVPLLNLFIWIVLGAKGSEWAWRNKRWDSVEHFLKVQRSWARWGMAIWLLVIAACIALFMTIVMTFKSSEAFTRSMAAVEANAEVIDAIGSPISTGLPMGRMETSGPTGTANIQYSISGPKGKGTVYVEAVKDMGAWQIQRLVVEDDKTGKRIGIAP